MIPDIYTQNILPHPLLQPFIRCYAIRRFDTKGCEFAKPIYADHEATLTFFIRSKLYSFDAANKDDPAFTANTNNIPECPLEGIQTSTKGFAVFMGKTLLLTVHFKLTGIFRIFKIPSKDLFDKIYIANDILSNEIKVLQERLHETYDLKSIINLVEIFLLESLASQKPVYKNEGIVKASCFLDKNITYNIKKLAADCNMTLQTFEVNFKELPGLSPKQFILLKRFNAAVNLKLFNPQKTWTDVAHACNYYDQNHLIKDFKEFTLMSPREFMVAIHPPFENIE